MTTDPQFPDRPTHPDFNRLSAILLSQDEVTDLVTSIEKVIDRDTLDYVTTQRAGIALRALGMLGASAETASRSIWLDAFLVGARFVQEGGHVEDTL